MRRMREREREGWSCFGRERIGFYRLEFYLGKFKKASLEMLRCIRTTGKLASWRKILFVSITGERCNCFVPRNTDESRVCSLGGRGGCARYDASNVWPTF